MVESLFFLRLLSGAAPQDTGLCPVAAGEFKKRGIVFVFYHFCFYLRGALGRILLFKNILLENNFQKNEFSFLHCLFVIFLLYFT